jgi:phage tail-like protein
MARIDPLRNFRFRLEIDGIQQAGFSEVTGFDATVEPVEYREGTDPKHVRKLSGLVKYGNISLKWGITDSKDIYEWFKAGVDGYVIRKNIAIVAVDEAGNDKARWEIQEAWPTKYDPPDFNAKGNDIAIESLEIVHEGMKRVV